MSREFLMPDPGEGIHEADILEVFVSVGDEVKDGDRLFSVETDKAIVEIPSSFDGTIDEIRVDVGDVIEVGNVLLTFSGAGDRSGDADEEPEPAPSTEESDPSVADQEEPPEEPDRRRREPDASSSANDRPVAASPATRSLAKHLNVDLHDLEGSGPDGRIEPGDVQAAADGAQSDETDGDDQPSTEPVEQGEIEWTGMGSVRRATARQMSESWRQIPHVSHHDLVDITELEELRAEYGSELEEAGGKLSITVFLVKATSVALRDHPRFNAILDVEGNRVGLKSEHNIGVAVDTEDGLVVPVIRDVDSKSIADIAVELPNLARRMRSRDRSLGDMKGGTFTITNPGGIGGTSFNPIVNQPEVAILGAARAREVPEIAHPEGEGDQLIIVSRLELPLVLAFDHRVNDGADAARFMNSIKALLEDPERLLLRV